jgi:hypothetical protein
MSHYLKKPSLSEKNKLLEEKLLKCTEKMALLESELRQKDLTIKALMDDLRKIIEKEKAEPDDKVAQKRPVQSKYDDYFFTVKRPCEHWGEIKG